MPHVTESMRQRLTALHELESRLRDLERDEQNLRCVAGANVEGVLSAQMVCKQDIAVLRTVLLPELTAALEADYRASFEPFQQHLLAAVKCNEELLRIEQLANEVRGVSPGGVRLLNLSWPELRQDGHARFSAWAQQVPTWLQGAQAGV